MPVDNAPSPEQRPAPEGGVSAGSVGHIARRLLRGAVVASLATTDRDTGGAYASLVQIASTADAHPLLLISRLARHTRNLLADPRASLLLDVRGSTGDPLASPRATLMGRVSLDASTRNLDRFLRRHPAAEAYATFSDFRLWTLAIERAHVVAGFGRIEEVTGAEVILKPEASSDMGRLLGTLRDDEAAIIARLQTRRDQRGGVLPLARIVGLDIEGVDLVSSDGHHRIEGSAAARSLSELDAWIGPQ